MEERNLTNTELTEWYGNLTYSDAKTLLEEKLVNIKMSFIAAGYYMKYIRDNELYKEDGYQSIWEFAEVNYGIQRTTASRWMAINDKFSKGGNSPILAEEYKDFEKSQLQEMLYLEDEQLKQVTPDMTVKEIRESRKKEEKQNSIERGCITGCNPYGNCVCCGYEGVECCAQCKEDCNSRCGWIPAKESCATSHMEEEHNEAWFVKEYTEKYIEKDYLLGLMEICRENKNDGDRAKAIQKYIAPYGYSAMDSSEFSYCFYGFSGGIDFRDEQGKRVHMKYGRFVVELLKLFDPFSPEFYKKTEPDIETVCGEVTEEREDTLHPEPEEVIVDGEYTELPEEQNEDMDDEPEERSDMDLLKEMLEKEKKLLKDILECCSEKEYIARRQKIRVAALANMLCEFEDMSEEQIQPALPRMRNNEQRKEFIDNYMSWPLWIESKETGERYYRYNFENGSSFVVRAYFHRCFDYKATAGTKYEDRFKDRYGSEEYYLLTEGKYFKDCLTNRSQLIEHLKNIQKGE